MTEILRLEDFAFTRLHVDWHEPDGLLPEPSALIDNTVFDYDVYRRNDAMHSLALQMRLHSSSTYEGDQVGYEIDTEIVGFFNFPETMTEDEIQALVRINGGTILYGIVRGEIAAFTGSFPGGKFVLPAVYMTDVVDDIERRKEQAAAKRRIALRKAAKNAANKRKKSTL
jgi:hypothetical protein